MGDAIDLNPPKENKIITDGTVKRVFDDNPFKDTYKKYLSKKESK